MKNKKMGFISVKDVYHLVIILLIKVNGWFSSPGLREFMVSSLVFLAHRFSIEKRRIIEKNVSKAFDGSLSEEQKRKIIRGAFRVFWQDVFLFLPFDSDKAEFKRAELYGIGRLHEAIKNGKGVILWESNGFGRRLASKQILYENGFSVCQVHSVNHLGGFLTESSSATWVRDSIVNRFFENREKQFVGEIITLPDSNSLAFTRVLLDRLKQNAVICATGDGKTGQKLIPLRFLGQTDFFSTGMISLAKVSGAPILPLFCVREKGGKTSLIIERPIRIETDGDRERGLEDGASEYAGLLETYIGRYPEQYRNWHVVGRPPDIRF